MDMFTRRAYRDQPVDVRADIQSNSTRNHRYVILASDFSRLYRQHNLQSYGIDVNITPENNVNNWLDPSSRHYKPEVAEAVFKYRPRLKQEDRFRICIATNEMGEAAWKYCHKRQLVLDGTFGLCSSRLLLWIALGVDSANNGIPVALFLFSAPTGNRATHAGYDTQILTELLGYWCDWLNMRRPASSDPFCPCAAMTDTDTKERSALITIWPTIILLLCKFHLRQCWTNKQTALLSNLKDTSFWKTHFESQLSVLQKRYVYSTSSISIPQLITSWNTTTALSKPPSTKTLSR